MMYKYVSLNQNEALQVNCESCGLWQFKSEKCSECGHLFPPKESWQLIQEPDRPTLDIPFVKNLNGNPKKNNYYRPYELSKKLGVAKQTIYRWIRDGKIPGASVKKMRIEKEVVIIYFPDTDDHP